jgi:transposase, IS5 family
MRGQPGFFDIDDRLKRLSDLGDQLETFRSAVNFELFRPELNAALSYTDRPEGGRPPFDPVLMFKILVIQATNNLSDERAEFLQFGRCVVVERHTGHIAVSSSPSFTTRSNGS